MKPSLLITLLFFAQFGFSQTTFNRYYANQSTSESSTMMDGIVTNDGGSVGVGYVGFNTSGRSLILKFDAAGDTLWVRKSNGSSVSYFSSVELDQNGDIIVAGFNDGQATISKFDNSGNHIWSNELDVTGNNNAQVQSTSGTFTERPQLAVTGSEFYLATSSRNVIGGSPDSLHFHLASFDLNGGFNWSKRLNLQTGFTGEFYDISESYVSGLMVHSSGNILMSGMHTSWSGSNNLKRTFVAEFDNTGNYLNNVAFFGSGIYQGLGICGIKESPSGNILAYGRASNLVTTSNNGPFIMELDASLNQIQTHIFGTSGYCYDILFDGNNDLHMLIEEGDISSDGFNRTALVKLDNSYNVVWANDYGSYQSEEAKYIGLYPNGDFCIISSTTGFISGARKVYNIRVNSDGLTVGCFNNSIAFSQESLLVPASSLTPVNSNSGVSSVMAYNQIPLELTYFDADIEYSETIEQPLCNGDIGSVELTMISTSGPFTYQWSNGTTSDILIDNSGSYDVVIRDAYGCLKLDTFEIVDPAILDASAIASDVSCYGFGDASIDLTVTGGTPGYTYDWITGQTTEDLNAISGGFYQVTVTDANGCEDILGVSVSEPLPLNAVIASSELTSCYQSCDGQLNGIVTGGSAPYSVLWNDPMGQTNDTATNLCAGQYLLTVTDNNGCVVYSNGEVYEPSELTASLGSTSTICASSNGSAWADPVGGTAPYSYNWSNGGNTDTILNLDQQMYNVTVTDNNGCTFLDSVLVTPIVQPVEICVVTVDTNNQNVIVWEKPIINSIAGFNIYRNIAGAYTLVGYQPYDSISEYIDNDFGVDPDITSYRYKISVLDSCGNESDLSAFHETIHLTANVGLGGEVNLIWDDYEGVSFNEYEIWRDSTGNGDWETIGTTLSSSFTFTDNNVPQSSVNLRYSIEVVLPNSCVSQRANTYGSTRSNKQLVAGPAEDNSTSIDESILENMNVYPNPANEMFTISINANDWNYKLYDLSGRMVKSDNAQNTKMNVYLNDLERGTYLLEVEHKGSKITKKVIKQ